MDFAVDSLLLVLIEFQVKIGLYNHGAPYRFHIHSPAYSEVKLSWIFLGISLVGNTVLFPLFRFSPPRYIELVLFNVWLINIIPSGYWY